MHDFLCMLDIQTVLWISSHDFLCFSTKYNSDIFQPNLHAILICEVKLLSSKGLKEVVMITGIQKMNKVE